MSKTTNKTRTIAFRLTDEEYTVIEEAAASGGENANDWCRNLCLAKACGNGALTENERMIFEEMVRVRYLLANGFGLLAAGNLTDESWSKQKAVAEQKSKLLADTVITKRKSESNES